MAASSIHYYEIILNVLRFKFTYAICYLISNGEHTQRTKNECLMCTLYERHDYLLYFRQSKRINNFKLNGIPSQRFHEHLMRSHIQICSHYNAFNFHDKHIFVFNLTHCDVANFYSLTSRSISFYSVVKKNVRNVWDMCNCVPH